MDKKLYTVGQAAEICSISVQTLRYYDRIGLMKPSLVDKANNYRYYSDQDIRYLYIIREMKEIGFSLEEMKESILKDKDIDISALLERNRLEYTDKLNSTVAMLSRIDRCISNLRGKDRAAETIAEFMKIIEGDHPGGNSVTGTPEDAAPMASKALELDIPYIVNQPLPEMDERNQAWIQMFHSRDGSLEAFYTDNALLFPSGERYLQGAASIRDFYKNYGNSFRIKEFRVDYRVQLTENRGMVYETGSFVTDTEEMYQYLTVWTQDDNIWLHELDVISARDISLTADPLIDTARNQWIELANANSAKKLAKELYNSDFVYYNRGSLYEGYENLAGVYSYMDNENYKINLTKDICVMVQPDLAYEIGTWTSAGSGSYLIVWRYTEDKWGIHLDTNW